MQRTLIRPILMVVIFQLIATRSLIAQADKLEMLTDEFNDSATFSQWTTFHQAEHWPSFVLQADVNTTSPGHFYLEPNTGFWFGEVHAGPYFFKTVKGDFRVETRVRANGHNTSSPVEPFSLAGLMVRSPRPLKAEKTAKKLENWLFITTGYARGKRQPQIETKVTRKSKSKLEIFPARSGWIELAISRTGQTFTLSYKDEKDNWLPLRTEVHPRMSEAIQVGMLAYTDFNGNQRRRYLFGKKKINTKLPKSGKPDLKASFDYIRFSKVRPDTKARR